MKCTACNQEISKIDMDKSAKAGDGAWCPKCVKRLGINIRSNEIIWQAAPDAVETTEAAVPEPEPPAPKAGGKKKKA